MRYDIAMEVPAGVSPVHENVLQFAGPPASNTREVNEQDVA
jgi:hypothetical protein